MFDGKSQTAVPRLDLQAALEVVSGLDLDAEHILPEGLYTIRSKFGCDDPQAVLVPAWMSCDAELSWDTGSGPHPMASVEYDDHTDWELVPVVGKASVYLIRNKYECALGHAWCDAELSWDPGSDHPMASVEFGDRVEWRLVPGQGPRRFRILSTKGCDTGGAWCDAELSWDDGSPHPMASLEFDDPVEWEICQAFLPGTNICQ